MTGARLPRYRSAFRTSATGVGAHGSGNVEHDPCRRCVADISSTYRQQIGEGHERLPSTPAHEARERGLRLPARLPLRPGGGPGFGGGPAWAAGGHRRPGRRTGPPAQRPHRRARAALRAADARLRDDPGAGEPHRRHLAAQPRLGLPDPADCWRTRASSRPRPTGGAASASPSPRPAAPEAETAAQTPPWAGVHRRQRLPGCRTSATPAVGHHGARCKQVGFTRHRRAARHGRSRCSTRPSASCTPSSPTASDRRARPAPAPRAASGPRVPRRAAHRPVRRPSAERATVSAP